MKRSDGILVSFMGWSGSGKTTFIEKCIKLLSGRGPRARITALFPDADYILAEGYTGYGVPAFSLNSPEDFVLHPTEKYKII